MHTVDATKVKLGLNVSRRDPRTLKLSKYTATKNLVPPASVDWYKKVSLWPTFDNDRIGDCAFAALGHRRLSVKTYTDLVPETYTTSQVIEAYGNVTGYTPTDPSTDCGTCELDALKYMVKTGIDGHKLRAFVSVNRHNIDEVKNTINIFGSVYSGFMLPLSAQTQGDTWTFDTSSGNKANPGSWGGHAISIFGYDAGGLYFVSWGQLMSMSWTFFRIYCSETWALLSDDWADQGDTNMSPSGLDLESLEHDLTLVKA